MTKKQLDSVGKFDLFERLTNNFIQANTQADIHDFTTHGVVMALMNRICR